MHENLGYHRVSVKFRVLYCSVEKKEISRNYFCVFLISLVRTGATESIKYTVVNYPYFFPPKNVSVLFTFRPFNLVVANIKYKNHYFEALNHFKYLDINLDSKLTCKYHIQHLRDRVFNATHILKSFSPTKWGGDPSNSFL